MSDENKNVIPINTGKELSVVSGPDKKPGISLDIKKEDILYLVYPLDYYDDSLITYRLGNRFSIMGIRPYS